MKKYNMLLGKIFNMKSIIVIALAVLVSACSSSTDVPGEKQDEKPFCIPKSLKEKTRIQEVHMEEMQEHLALTGKIEYDQNDLVSYKNMLEGVVESVEFELGDKVKKGQTLAVVQSSQVMELIQSGQARKMQTELLTEQIKTKKELMRDGLASKLDVMELEFELNDAKAESHKIGEQLALYQSTGKNGFYKILAPKDGYIVQKNISSGQTLSLDNDPLFSISNLNEVWVFINIYANNLRYIHVGDPVKVRTIAYPDEIYEGKIDKIFNVFDESEHVLKARVVLQNPKMNLFPGLVADILLKKNSSGEKAVAIPNGAIIFNNNKQYVLVYNADCSIEARNILSLGQNELHTYIRDQIKPGEKIILDNALLIFEALNQ